MRISREARVLLALVAIAAAVWVWINYLSQAEEVVTTPSVPVTALNETAPDRPQDATAAEDASADLTETSSPFGVVTPPAAEGSPAPADSVSAASPGNNATPSISQPDGDTAGSGGARADTMVSPTVAIRSSDTGGSSAGASAAASSSLGAATLPTISDSSAVPGSETGGGGLNLNRPVTAAAFRTFDADAGGSLDDMEFRVAFDNAGLFGQFDTDASGAINEEEFGTVNAEVTAVNDGVTSVNSGGSSGTGGGPSAVGTNTAAFTDFDIDASGDVDESELSTGFFAAFDTDTSGSVDENEFDANSGRFGATFNTSVDDVSVEGAAAEGVDAAVPGVAALQDAPVQDGRAEPLSAVAPEQPLTAREVEVAELPFLITEPPALNVPETDAAVPDLDLARPSGNLRATVNPFSPILLAPPPDQPQTALAGAGANSPFSLAPPTTPSGIVDVPIPDAPLTNVSTAPGLAPLTSARVTAPAPQLLTPRGGLTASLPRPLPGGTLPATPELLTKRTTESVAAETSSEVAPLVDFATVATLRLPGSDTRPDFADAVPPALQEVKPSEAEPLRLTGLSGRGPTASNPIASGASGLTRFLRDSNYRFTGYVISAVGVGVFRSNETAAPVVVTLGQTIPGTDIVLTSLKGEQAELTLNDEKQVLILNPGG